MLDVLMGMLNFLIGGFTGVFLADVPADFQFNNTYFVVAHFHYTIIGGMVFAWLAALHYWFPKFSGRMYSEAVGKLAASVAFIAFNATFFPMFIAVVQGINQSVSVYLTYHEAIQPWISLLEFLLWLAFF